MNEALSLFFHMIRISGTCKLDYKVYTDVLKSCAVVSDISLGKVVHGHIFKLGHHSCQFISKALLNMYGKCKALDDCQKLFGQIGYRDTVIWNILLSSFAVSRTHDQEAMRLFCSMHVDQGPKPSSVTLAIILPVCARYRSLDAAKSVHCYAIKCGLESHTLVGNALVSGYSKIGNVSEAVSVFDEIAEKDVVSWNAVIAGFAENGLIENALILFQWMLKGPIEPNYATVVNILPVCASLQERIGRHFGKEIHCYALRRAELAMEVTVTNALLSFYLRVGQMREAESLFCRMKLRDLVSWNSVIAGYASTCEWLKALGLFQELVDRQKIKPDSVTLISILPAFTQSCNLQAGKQIHGYVVRHHLFYEGISIQNALISFYAKCGSIKAALQTFLFTHQRDLISWNTMLDAFSEYQLEDQFVSHVQQMFRKGVRPDSITMLTLIKFCAKLSAFNRVKEAHGFSIRYGLLLADTEPTLANALLDAYAKCGSIEYAHKTFENMSGKRNAVTCNSMISAYMEFGLYNNAQMIFQNMANRDLTTFNLMVRVYAENDCPDQALSLFHELCYHAMKPDAMTLMSLLFLCAQLASAHMLIQCHGYMLRSCFDDLHLIGALIDVYSKCGSIDCAHTLFQSTRKKDLVIFTAMIGGYAMHGMGGEALRVYNIMLGLGLKPDHIVITAILSACSHAGLVDEGLQIFYSLEKMHHIKPRMEHYACVVDLLARGGRIKDAYSFVHQMPIEVNANIWGTLLGACRTHHEMDIGRAVADRLFEVNSKDIGNYVVMSNLYAADARWDGVVEIRRLMKRRDLKKPAGSSWIEVEGSKNVFIAGNCMHPQRSTIYVTLSNLNQQIKDVNEF